MGSALGSRRVQHGSTVVASRDSATLRSPTMSTAIGAPSPSLLSSSVTFTSKDFGGFRSLRQSVGAAGAAIVSSAGPSSPRAASDWRPTVRAVDGNDPASGRGRGIARGGARGNATLSRGAASVLSRGVGAVHPPGPVAISGVVGRAQSAIPGSRHNARLAHAASGSAHLHESTGGVTLLADADAAVAAAVTTGAPGAARELESAAALRQSLSFRLASRKQGV